MADIWARVDEAIDTDPLQLRGIVAELLAHVEHAEGAAVVNRERTNEFRQERDALKAAVQHLAAEAHRRKWAHEHSAPAAFDVLHRIGNELKAALDTPAPTTRTETA